MPNGFHIIITVFSMSNDGNIQYLHGEKNIDKMFHDLQKKN